jgi:hypothetical protein
VPFYFTDDILLHDLPLEAAQRVLQRLTILELYLSQMAPPTLTRCNFFILFKFTRSNGATSRSAFARPAKARDSVAAIAPCGRPWYFPSLAAFGSVHGVMLVPASCATSGVRSSKEQ